MTEHHPFRVAGGPGRVHDGRQVGRPERGFATRQFRRVAGERLPAAAAEVVPGLHPRAGRRGVKRGDARESRQLVTDLAHLVGLGGRGDEQPAGARIVHLEMDLAGAERNVRRNGDAPGRQDAEIGNQPLDAVLAKQADAVAGSEAGLDESRRAPQDVRRDSPTMSGPSRDLPVWSVQRLAARAVPPAGGGPQRCCESRPSARPFRAGSRRKSARPNPVSCARPAADRWRRR